MTTQTHNTSSTAKYTIGQIVDVTYSISSVGRVTERVVIRQVKFCADGTPYYSLNRLNGYSFGEFIREGLLHPVEE